MSETRDNQKVVGIKKRVFNPWIHLGKIFEKQRRNEHAIEAYQKAIEIDPKNAHIWNEMGNAFINSGRNEEAINAFNKAIELDRGYGCPYSNLALAYSNKGKYQEATLLFQRSIELSNNDRDKAISWNRLGDAYRGLNEYGKATEAYQRADELAPGNAAVKDHRGKVKKDMSEPVDVVVGDGSVVGEVEPADGLVQDNVQVVDNRNEISRKVDTNNAHIWNELGNIYFNVVAYDDAINSFSKAIELDKTLGLPFRNLALTFVLVGRFDEAIPLYQKSIELLSSNRDKATAWNGLGNSFRHMNNYTEAISAYQKAVELDPANTLYSEDLNNLLNEAGTPEELVSVNKDEISSDPLMVESRASGTLLESYLGEIEDRQERFDASDVKGKRDAVTHTQMEEVIDQKETTDTVDAVGNRNMMESENAQVWNELGDVYYNVGAFEEAISAYSKAIALDPGYGSPHSNLALAYSRKGRYGEAIPLFQRSIELLTNNNDIALSWKRLGNAYRRLNDYNNAVAAYQKADELEPNNVSLFDKARFSLTSNCQVG